MLKKIILGLLMISLTACGTFSKPKINAPGPQAADINVQLGLAYLQSGDVQRAKQKLLLAEQQAPESIESQGAMAFYLESTGNLTQAEAHYRRAVILNPKSGAAQNNYGTFLCRKGSYKDADQHFLLALKDPNYLNTSQVYENAGLCAMQIPDVSKAINYFNQAIKQDPKHAMSWLELGRISYQQKNYQEAQQYLEHYMELTKDPSPNALWLGAVLARALGDAEGAGRYTLMLQTRFPNSDAYKTLVKTPKIKNTQKKKQLYY